MQENPSKDRIVQIAGGRRQESRIQNSGARRIEARNPGAGRAKLRLSRGFPRGTRLQRHPLKHSFESTTMPGHLHDLRNFAALFGLHEMIKRPSKVCGVEAVDRGQAESPAQRSFPLSRLVALGAEHVLRQALFALPEAFRPTRVSHFSSQ